MSWSLPKTPFYTNSKSLFKATLISCHIAPPTQSEMLVCGSGWQKEEPRLSRDSSATRVFQTQEILHKSEMPWKGTSSLLSSLSITNSGSRLTLAQWWKGLKAVGLGEHFGWDLFRLYLLTQHYGVSMATGTCFSVLHVERLYFTCNKSSLVRKMWSCATSFLVV